MLNRGSEWRRWEPHIHAPGTVMNNQFSGPTAWSDYLTALEQATPAIEVIAVTDYYVTDTYEEVLRHKAAGRLPATRLIFPNVELRLDVATARGGFVNLHLFVSPEDPNHVEELQRLLSRLQFNVMQDRFDCTRADLIRLGKKAANQDVREGGSSLTLPTGRDLDAMHKVKVEISVGSQSEEMIVVIGRRDRRDGDLGRIGRAGRDELPRPTKRLDGFVIGGRGADGDNLWRVRVFPRRADDISIEPGRRRPRTGGPAHLHSLSDSM